MKAMKKLMFFALIVFLLFGIFMNSSFVTNRKAEAYAKIKEEFHLSSDTETKETISEKQAELTDKESTEEIKEEDNKTEVKEESIKVTSRGGGHRTTENIIWDYLVNAGYSKIQTAGIIGNLYQESGLNPARVESNGEGIGLVQWSFGRKQELKDFAKSKGTDWTDLNTQLEFLIKELKGGRQFTGEHKNTFSNPYSVDDAVEAFCFGFERPNKELANLANRKAKAWAAYYRNVDR